MRALALSVQPEKVGRKVGRLETRINRGFVQPSNLSNLARYAPLSGSAGASAHACACLFIH